MYLLLAKQWDIAEIAITDSKTSMRREEELSLLEISRKKPILANRVDPAIEKAVVDIAIDCPAYGQLRVSNELKKQGKLVSL